MDKQGLIQRLKELERVPDQTQGFASQQAAVIWASEVAPLLRFEPRYYEEFSAYARRLPLRLSSDFQISNLNRLKAIIHEAIVALEADIPDVQSPESALELERPEHVTLAWLWNHVPYGVWASLIAAFVVVFLAGTTFGRSYLYERLITPHTSTTNTTRSQENVAPPKKSNVDIKKSN